MKTIWVVVFAVLACGSSMLAQRPAAQQVEPKAQVLIVTEKSEFKQDVVAKVTEALKNANRSCRVADLKALRDARPEDHEVVVILNEIWAWRLRSEVRGFLKRLTPEQRGRIILVSTAGREDWQAGEKGIDAITTASTVAKEQKTADFILGRIDAIVAAERKQ
jgi:hypothetical protein